MSLDELHTILAEINADTNTDRSLLLKDGETPAGQSARILRNQMQLGALTNVWMLDEVCDNESERFGLVLASSPQVDKALRTWAHHHKAWETGDWDEDEEPPLYFPVGPPGDQIAFIPNLTQFEVRAIEITSDNSTDDRIRYLSPLGVELLVKAISTLKVGETLLIYKGRMYRSGDNEAQNRKYFLKLWDHTTPGPE